MRLADDVLIRESVRQPEQFAPLFDRHAVAIHRYLARRATTTGPTIGWTPRPAGPTWPRRWRNSSPATATR
ncbi:hypothetical protein [Actinoplanes philippinensis]|uniref:hypothetical protein n=1 Tax=Actinoplanes philippinensis TaxID=35752 RepID=UPI00340B12D7